MTGLRSMFRSLVVAFALVCGLALPAQAQDEGGFGDYAEFLVYVAPTKIPIEFGVNARTMSLCHLQKRWGIRRIPYRVESGGWALSEDNCEGDYFYPLSEERFIGYQERGLIDKALPSRPELTRAERFLPYMWLVVGGLLAAGAVIVWLRDRWDKRGSKPTDAFVGKLVGVMCHAASFTDAPRERVSRAIGQFVSHTTRRQVQSTKILMHLQAGDTTLSPGDIANLGKGLRPLYKELIMQGAWMIMGPAETQSDDARNFVLDLKRGLGLTEAQFRHAASEASALR